MDQVKREIEHRWRDLGEFVREQRRLGQMSLRRLSELSGISNPYLSQIERGMRRPSAEILQQLARALEISSETLYVRAGILDEAAGDNDLLDAIRRDAVLTEPQKRTLIHIYESFRNEALTARVAAGEEPGDPAVGTLPDERDTATVGSTVAEAVAPDAPDAVGGADGAESDADDAAAAAAPKRRRAPARKRAGGESSPRAGG